MTLSMCVPTSSQIKGLFENINFSTKVTRDTLEEICADLFERVDTTLCCIVGIPWESVVCATELVSLLLC